MKALFFVVSLAAALIALPASAQLGPAGVPGAPGLAETDPSVKSGSSAPQNSPQPQQAQRSQQRKHAPAECNKAKNVEQCNARQAARNKAIEACKDKTGAERKQCRQEQIQNVNCSDSGDPARCERHKKARELCKDKLGPDHRQCLRDNLVAKK